MEVEQCDGMAGPEPPGRPAGQPYYSHAGEVFAQPHSSHTGTAEFDFITPDCHLLGKKKVFFLSSFFLFLE